MTSHGARPSALLVKATAWAVTRHARTSRSYRSASTSPLLDRPGFSGERVVPSRRVPGRG